MIAPLLIAPPSLESPVARAWFFDASKTVVNQVLTPQMNPEAVAFLTGPFERVIQERFVSKGLRIRSIHDWRACAGYELASREALLAWGRQGSAHTAESVIAFSEQASPFFRIALQTGALLLRGLRLKVSVVEDVSPLVRELSGEVPVPPLT
jgi:hypothetical protein